VDAGLEVRSEGLVNRGLFTRLEHQLKASQPNNGRLVRPVHEAQPLLRLHPLATRKGYVRVDLENSYGPFGRSACTRGRLRCICRLQRGRRRD
jgi:hypothetical protein